MADGFSIDVKGLDKARRAIYSYSRQLGDKVIIDALKLGAKVVQREAKSRAPRKSGRLARGIVIKKSKIHKAKAGSKSLGVYLTLRTGKGKKDPKDAFYGRFQEDGWNVRGEDREQLGRKGGRMQYAGRRQINEKYGKRRGRMSMPGKRDIQGKRFIKGAFEAKRNEAIKTIVAAVDKAAELLSRKMGLK